MKPFRMCCISILRVLKSCAKRDYHKLEKKNMNMNEKLESFTWWFINVYVAMNHINSYKVQGKGLKYYGTYFGYNNLG